MQLSKLEEHRLIALKHQEIQKQQQKAWHDRNIKNKSVIREPHLTIQQSSKRKTQKFTHIMDGTLRCRRDTHQWFSLTKDIAGPSILETR